MASARRRIAWLRGSEKQIPSDKVEAGGIPGGEMVEAWSNACLCGSARKKGKRVGTTEKLEPRMQKVERGGIGGKPETRKQKVEREN